MGRNSCRRSNRPAFDKAQAKALSDDLRKAVAELRDLLFSEDAVTVEVKQSTKTTENEGIKDEASIGVGGAKLGRMDEAGRVRRRRRSRQRSTRR